MKKRQKHWEPFRGLENSFSPVNSCIYVFFFLSFLSAWPLGSFARRARLRLNLFWHEPATQEGQAFSSQPQKKKKKGLWGQKNSYKII